MFSEQRYKTIIFQAFDPWWQTGFVHGFTNQSLEGLALSPQQVHGNCISIFDGQKLVPEVSDAIYLERNCEAKLFAIKTADCLPIIMRSKNEVALIHSGWRGLANGIINKTVKKFQNSADIEVIIGPAAGMEKYEVGIEVIEAIGESAVYRKLDDKIYLSLSKTAEKQLSGYPVYDIGVCTISSLAWYSYRRDLQKHTKAGFHTRRNFAFVVF